MIQTSKDTIGIDPFCINSNGLSIEKPDEKSDGIGFIACGGKQKYINVYPDSTMTWKIDLKSRYFEPYPFIIRPKKNGTYKFYWVVNDIKSEEVIYEYVLNK